MLPSVLNSDRGTAVTIEFMRSLMPNRRLLVGNKALAHARMTEAVTRA